jgi:hypothetical protein
MSIYRLKMVFQVIRNMGFRYTLFRFLYTFKIKIGWFKSKFPSSVKCDTVPSLEEWRNGKDNFIIDFSEILAFENSKPELEVLNIEAERIRKGDIKLFSHEWLRVEGWLIHPVTKHKYSKKHFSEIDDFSKVNGDIKYIWEKARFSWIYTLIRFENQSGISQVEFILTEIESFIDSSPLNFGPHYKCSQEMSLRVYNWSFALFFYKNSGYLTDSIFRKIMSSINGHIDHVYKNINFSRIAVRNNHAITETLALLLVPTWFSFLPKADQMKADGKRWFEEEIEYQIYDDGGYLQYSHNYHRVVVQLLTWAFLQEKRGSFTFKDVVRQRAIKSFDLLSLLMQKENGWLPNYGQNDGALFFPLNNCHYRDYRPQIQALGFLLGKLSSIEMNEDSKWYGLDYQKEGFSETKLGQFSFEKYGHFIIKESNSLTVINNPKYVNRPAQSDQLHLDISVNGVNVLFDPGTFMYNTEEKYIKFFFGTKGHNTLQIGDYDQMQKGIRFIWYNWIKTTSNKQWEGKNFFYYEGSFMGYYQFEAGVKIHRRIRKSKKELYWIVEDSISYKDRGNLGPIRVHWNIAKEVEKQVRIKAYNEKNEPLQITNSVGWNAPIYGDLKESNQLEINSNGIYIKTEIRIDENLIDTPILP